MQCLQVACVCRRVCVCVCVCENRIIYKAVSDVLEIFRVDSQGWQHLPTCSFNHG